VLAVRRLLMVTPTFLPSQGGVQTHVFEVGRRLAARGVEVTVLTTNHDGTLAARQQLSGMNVVRQRSWPRRADYYVAPGMYAAVANGGWDVVHCQGCHTFVPPLAMLAALRAGVPYVVTFHTGGHSTGVRNFVRPLQWRAQRLLYAHASRLVGVSRFEKDLFRRTLGLPEDRFSVIPNGVEPLGVHAEQDSPKQPIILSLGRLERYKGHHRVIDALPYVLREIPEARLRIVGGGPYEQMLRERAVAAGVGEHVEMFSVPGADRARMAEVLDQAALVTLLSEYEAHPIAVLEAIAHRCPALVADSTGLAELAEDGLARAIPLASTPQQVAAAILRELRSPSPPPSVELPDWDACTDRLLSVYNQMVQERACAS
jgi:glycosyltransferase involved in cell wall biosynthesis